MGKSLRIILAATLSLTSLASFGQKEAVFNPETASIEENIRTPEVKQKHHDAVVAKMNETSHSLKEAGYAVTPVRSGEVLMVVIPCATLFGPNETALSQKGEYKLEGLKQYVRNTEDFKTVIAVHSDNTGDSTYADRLTSDRANAIDEYFYKTGSYRETGIIPYGIGSDEPVAANHGSANRARNRRVEFYFIPTQAFIDKARKK